MLVVGLITIGKILENIKYQDVYIWETNGKTRENPYPCVEGMGFVRVQIRLLGHIVYPTCEPAGFQTCAIPSQQHHPG